MKSKYKKTVAKNKKAWHDYFVDEKLEAGIVLTGTEIKSVRMGKVSIKESYIKIDKKGELIVYGMHISPYEQGNIYNVDPLRERKLLMHKKEIARLAGKIKLKGVAIIPLEMYIDENGKAKLEIGVCRGKKNYDKRESIAKKDAKRKMDRAIKRH